MDVVEAVVNGLSHPMVKFAPVNVIHMFHPVFTLWVSIVADFNRHCLTKLTNRYVHVLYELNINVVTRFFV